MLIVKCDFLLWSLIEMIRWKKKGMLFLKCALKQSGTLCSGVSAVYKNIGSRCVIEIIITDSLIMSSPYNVRWYARSFLSYQYLHIFVIMIHKNNGSVKGSGDKWGKQNRWGRCERIEEFRWCRHKKNGLESVPSEICMFQSWEWIEVINEWTSSVRIG